MAEKTSRMSGFHKLSTEDRLKKVGDYASLSNEELETLRNSLIGEAEHMIENVIGTMQVPLGVATNFLINGKDYLIPMATEEPSVVAAASNGARMVRESGGFRTESTEPIMVGQIQLADVADPEKAGESILSEKKRLLAEANKLDPVLIGLGGGAKDIVVRMLDSQVGRLLLVHVHVDVRDAMGANAVNTMCEALAPKLEKLCGGKAYLRIVSNYCTKRLAKASATVSKEVLGGVEVVDGIVACWALADADVYRAVTHNKGIMNGVTAVALATGNDTRAVEAGAHSYAARDGVYRPLSTYRKNKDGNLECEIELPLAVGLVGGATKSHPTARISKKILGVESARELAEVSAAVGLAQNLAALRALATEGIQTGHMRLHAKNIATSAGAKKEDIDHVAKKMIDEGKIRVDRAREILGDLR